MANLPKKTDQGIDFTTFSQNAKDVQKLNNLQFDPTVFIVYEDPSGIYVSTWAGSDLVATPTEFEIKTIAGYTVTIYGGIFTIGKTDFTIADTPLTITTDCTIGIEYTFGGGAAIVNFGSSYAQDDDHIRVRLYALKYGTGGAEVVKKCKHVIFPGEWGV